MPCSRGDRFLDDLRGALRERGKDPAGMQPAHPDLPEQPVPVELARGELGGSGVRAVGHAAGAAHAKAAFGEVEPVSDAAADAVVGDPAHQRGIDPSLKHQILDQPADVVVGDRRRDRRAHAEAASQPAGDVVLAAALPDAELARVAHAALAGVQPQHHLAEGDEVVAALIGGPHGKDGHPRAAAAIETASAASLEIASKSPLRMSAGATIQLPPTAATVGRDR